jgi:hypothetical protein
MDYLTCLDSSLTLTVLDITESIETCLVSRLSALKLEDGFIVHLRLGITVSYLNWVFPVDNLEYTEESAIKS